MNDKELKRLLQEEMQREADLIMAEVNADPLLRDVKAPPEIKERLFAQIREYEEQKAKEQLTAEERELIRLGKIYRRRRKVSRYAVLVAALVAMFALGSVCFGDGENIFTYFTHTLDKGEQSFSDTESTEPIMYVSEDEVVKKIKKTYNFMPVTMDYLPEGTVFYEAMFYADSQDINMIYEVDDQTNIIYIIRPVYRESSLSSIIEDEKIQEYQMNIGDIEVTISEFRIEESDGNRWSVHFVYQSVEYFLRITNMEQTEVEKIVKNLSFAK